MVCLGPEPGRWWGISFLGVHYLRIRGDVESQGDGAEAPSVYSQLAMCVFFLLPALIPLLKRLEPSAPDRVQTVAGQVETEVWAGSNMQPVQVSALAAPIASESLPL